MEVGQVQIYEGLVSVKVVKPAVPASWQLSKLGFYPPTKSGKQSLTLPDDYISKEWLSGP